ncbi:MAG: molybdopterin-dependent oxidoreductase, partial [bacterium]
RFLGAFGSSGFFHMPSADDAWEAVTWKLTGRGFVPGYDLERATTVLSFGCAIVEGWGSPLRSMHARSLWKENGTTLVQVEPRLSNTAAAADRWIACNPGAEADLALGMCRVLLESYPECRERLGAAVTTPDEFSSHLYHHYSLEQVAAITGLTGSMIESLAVDFAASKHPLAICGKDEGRSPIAAREVFATLMLNILVGRINRPGGLYCIERKSDSRLSAKSLHAPEKLFAAAAETSEPSVELLLVAGANPCYSQSNPRKTVEAVRKMPFVVSFSSHWNETAMNSNLVLPVHSHLEGTTDFPVYSGLKQPKLGLSKPVSKRLFNSRYMGDVLIETASRLGDPMAPFFPWGSYETCLKQSLGDRWQELTEKTVVDLPQPKIKSIPMMNTSAFHSLPTRLTGSSQEYPLTLISKVSMRLNNNADASSPFMMKTVEESVLRKNRGFVDINPDTADEQNLSEADSVMLETPHGQATVSVHLDAGTAPGLLVMARGLGHGAVDEYSGGKGTNVNELLGEMTDPLTGYNIAWGARAALKKV